MYSRGGRSTRRVPSHVTGDESMVLTSRRRLRQPGNRRLPAGDYRADVIDTWNMTIDSSIVTCDGTLRVDLPAREYMALSLTALGDVKSASD